MIAVVGSLNLDLVVRVARHPRPGETLLGSDYERHPGGKGANQAVAAARLGGRVRMVGRVGDDDFGSLLRSALVADGVDVDAVAVASRPTGVAFIQVAQGGQNTIVVAPGANDTLRPADLDGALFRGCRALLLQLEVPLDTVRRAARLAREAGARVVLNNAPAASLGARELADVSLLLVNESEAALTLGRATEEVVEAPQAAAHDLCERVPAAVVTLGERGVAWAERGEPASYRAAFPVTAVDTTAAGDAFAGALAVRLAAGDALDAAVRFASAAGALATTRPGAQPSLPGPDAVAALLEGTRQ